MKKAKLTQKEVGRLRRAINDFNKEVIKHTKEGVDSRILPELRNYKDVKNSIYTQRDYELTIRTLERIKNKNAFAIRKSKENPNVQFTNWEYQTLKQYNTRNRQRHQKELNKLLKLKENKKPRF